MKDRIFELIESKGYTPTYFADEIDVERATISHIKSGRSKPSLTLVQNILERFPEVNPDWLISGHGTMYREKSKPEQPNLFSQIEVIPQVSTSYEPKKEQNVVSEPQPKAVESPVIEPTPPVPPKKIDRIVVFYSDNTFEMLTNV